MMKDSSSSAWLPFAFAFGLTLTATAAANNTLVKEACQNAKHQELCVSTLGSDPEAASSDLQGLVMIGLRLAAADASNTSAFIHRSLNNKDLDPTVQQCLADCSDYYLDTVQQLDNCVAAITVNEYGDACQWIETSLEDVSACELEFKQRASANPGLLSGRNKMFQKLADNALAVINALH